MSDRVGPEPITIWNEEYQVMRVDYNRKDTLSQPKNTHLDLMPDTICINNTNGILFHLQAIINVFYWLSNLTRNLLTL